MEEYQPTSFVRSCASRSRCQTWTSDIKDRLISSNILCKLFPFLSEYSLRFVFSLQSQFNAQLVVTIDTIASSIICDLQIRPSKGVPAQGLCENHGGKIIRQCLLLLI